MKIFFLLSGEHATLPKAEAIAALEAIEGKFEVREERDQILLVETDSIRDLHRRLAMSHAIFRLLCESEAEEEKIINAIEKLNLRFSTSFAVRMKRVKNYSRHIATMALERKIAEMINNKTRAKIDLTSPKNLFYGILSEGKFIFGKLLREVNRSQYERRRPHLRPFFHPGAMLPRNCRAIVNLARAKKGERFVDPFCGTGGFLIEAGLLGARVYGCDVDYGMVKGCEKNLLHYGIKDFSLALKDARELQREYRDFFDALAADLPYGISSSAKGVKLEELYRASLESFHEILKPRKYACVISPLKIPLEQLSQEAGFEIVEIHLERIHKSLTRKIAVLRK